MEKCAWKSKWHCFIPGPGLFHYYSKNVLLIYQLFPIGTCLISMNILNDIYQIEHFQFFSPFPPPLKYLVLTPVNEVNFSKSYPRVSGKISNFFCKITYETLAEKQRHLLKSQKLTSQMFWYDKGFFILSNPSSRNQLNVYLESSMLWSHRIILRHHQTKKIRRPSCPKIF